VEGASGVRGAPEGGVPDAKRIKEYLVELER
jgi:hypothetical protein